MKFVDVVTDCRIECGSFFRGERRKLDSSVAGFLIGNGWAKQSSYELEVEGKATDVAAVTLDVQSVGQDVESEDVGNG